MRLLRDWRLRELVRVSAQYGFVWTRMDCIIIDLDKLHFTNHTMLLLAWTLSNLTWIKRKAFGTKYYLVTKQKSSFVDIIFSNLAQERQGFPVEEHCANSYTWRWVDDVLVLFLFKRHRNISCNWRDDKIYPLSNYFGWKYQVIGSEFVLWKTVGLSTRQWPDADVQLYDQQNSKNGGDRPTLAFDQPWFKSPWRIYVYNLKSE